MAVRDLIRRLPTPAQDALRDRVYPKLLPEGDTAPEWHLQSWDDSWHRHGKHWSVLFFFADATDAADRAELSSLQSHLADFSRLNTKVFAANFGEGPAQKQLADELGLTFPLLTDRGGSVARLFRACVQLPMKPIYISTLYLLNPERKVRLSNRGRPSVEAVVRSVEALQRVSKTGM
jgi:peroxiredoxin